MLGKAYFQIVKEQIDRMDYCGLLAGGAPKDEFDLESGEISGHIHPTQSPEALAAVIARVFRDNFGSVDADQVFLPVAERILQAIHTQ